jgi:hypothetical protein
MFETVGAWFGCGEVRWERRRKGEPNSAWKTDFSEDQKGRFASTKRRPAFVAAD